MMENLTFDGGVKEYVVNGKGVLRFNPSDPNVYTRFLNLSPQIGKVEREMAKKAKAISETGSVAGEANLRILMETDAKIKDILNQIFGNGNDFDEILEGVNLMAVANNGKRVIENLMDALLPILEKGAKTYSEAKAGEIMGEAEQMRAARSGHR